MSASKIFGSHGLRDRWSAYWSVDGERVSPCGSSFGDFPWCRCRVFGWETVLFEYFYRYRQMSGLTRKWLRVVDWEWRAFKNSHDGQAAHHENRDEKNKLKAIIHRYSLP